MTAEEVQEQCPVNGIYLIHWKDGGSSLAAVGCFHDGSRWFAPTNWITVPACGGAWESVETVELLLRKIPSETYIRLGTRLTQHCS